MTWQKLSRFISHTGLQYNPGPVGQTELSPDKPVFERTYVLGALELHGLEKASSAHLSGQWFSACLIRGHFSLVTTV